MPIADGDGGYTYGGNQTFMLKDLNKDGREELLVKMNLDPDIIYNVLVPADTWQEANLGSFTAYNDKTGVIAMEYAGEVGGRIDYYSLEDDQLKMVDQYICEVNNVDSSIECYHMKADGSKLEISDEDYYNQPRFQWKEIEGEWITMAPTSLALISDIEIEDTVDIDMGKKITVSHYDHKKIIETPKQEKYKSVSEFITSNGFNVDNPIYTYRSIADKVQLLLYYDEKTEVGCVVIEKAYSLEGYSFVGKSNDINGDGVEKYANLKREYSNPLDVSNRVDIYSTELLTNLQEEKKTDGRGNVIEYYVSGKLVNVPQSNPDRLMFILCDYDKYNMLRHRIFGANSDLYGTSEAIKNTCYDSKGRVDLLNIIWRTKEY